jgi:hypothetical protein
MNIGEIVCCIGNIALSLHGIDNHLGRVDAGDENHALDLALEEWRQLALGLARLAPEIADPDHPEPANCVLAAVKLVRDKMDALPADERERIEVRLFHHLAVVTRAVADLLDELQIAASETAAAAHDVPEHA